MRAYWKATPESYFNHLTKAHILAAIREGVSEQAALELEGLKKEVMAERAADLLGSKGWLPPLMKGAAVPPT